MATDARLGAKQQAASIRSQITAAQGTSRTKVNFYVCQQGIVQRKQCKSHAQVAQLEERLADANAEARRLSQELQALTAQANTEHTDHMRQLSNWAQREAQLLSEAGFAQSELAAARLCFAVLRLRVQLILGQHRVFKALLHDIKLLSCGAEAGSRMPSRKPRARGTSWLRCRAIMPALPPILGASGDRCNLLVAMQSWSRCRLMAHTQYWHYSLHTWLLYMWRGRSWKRGATPWLRSLISSLTRVSAAIAVRHVTCGLPGCQPVQAGLLTPVRPQPSCCELLWEETHTAMSMSRDSVVFLKVHRSQFQCLTGSDGEHGPSRTARKRAGAQAGGAGKGAAHYTRACPGTSRHSGSQPE